MPQDVMNTTDIPNEIWEYIMFAFLSSKELFFLSLVNQHLLSVYRRSNALQKKIKENAFSIHCGGNQTFLLYRSPLEINSILATGYNRFGQLALPAKHQKLYNFTPISLPKDASIIDLRAGQRFALLTATDPKGKPQLFYTGSKNFVGMPIHKIHPNVQWVKVNLPHGIAKINGLAATRSHAAAFGMDSMNKPFAGIFGQSPIDLITPSRHRGYQNDFRLLALPTSLNTIEGMVLTDSHTFIWNEGMLIANGNLKNNEFHFTQPDGNRTFQTISTPMKRIAGGVSGEQFVVFYGTTETNQWVVAVAGENHCGQLGTGDTLSRNQLTIIEVPKPFAVIKGIAAGMFHFVIFGEDEKGNPIIAGSGMNHDGQLGLTHSECHHLTLIPLPQGIDTIISVSCGNHHTFVHAFGSQKEYVIRGGNNEYGQLGYEGKSTLHLWEASPRPAYAKSIEKPPETTNHRHGLFHQTKTSLPKCLKSIFHIPKAL